MTKIWSHISIGLLKAASGKQSSTLLILAFLSMGVLFGPVTAQRVEEPVFTTQGDALSAVRCDESILAGRYAVVTSGFAATPPAPLVPFASISLTIFDGMGNLTNKITRSLNGNISRSVGSGTYTVNADCTGTMTFAVPAPPFNLTFDIVVAELQSSTQANEFYFIATTPGSAITSRARRISQ
jgi:hypothetical protein